MTTEPQSNEEPNDEHDTPRTHQSLSRRATLGLLSLSGVGLLAGPASANPPGGKGDGPPTPWEDTDADGLLETPDFDGIDVGTVVAPTVKTSDDTPLDLSVNDERALRLEPTTDHGSNVIGGLAANSVTDDVGGATIAGGGSSSFPNKVMAALGTIGGGLGNTASGNRATVSGGAENTASGDEATVAGGQLNEASGISGATVGGGYSNVANGYNATIAGGQHNETPGTYDAIGGGVGNKTGGSATVSGGENNAAIGFTSTVAGGIQNTASASGATVGGGAGNEAGGINGSTVGGGNGNVADGYTATVGGGAGNTASGDDATIPGGRRNSATADYSFAAGRQAQADHKGAFVWADSTNARVASTGSDQFIARASGGVYFGTDSNPDLSPGFISTSTGAYLSEGGTWTNASSAARKTAFAPADPGEALSSVCDLPIQTWQYKDEDNDTRHVGPTAEAFHDTFEVGGDEQTISTVDADGIAFAAIQGLADEVESQSERQAETIAELHEQNAKMEERLSTELEAKDQQIRELREQNQELQDRLESLERTVNTRSDG
jgi:hypothetical protein